MKINRAVLRLFKKLIDIELSGSRGLRWEAYQRLLGEIADALELPRAELAPLNLNSEVPPPWVAASPELTFYWARARAAYRARPVPFSRTG